MTKVYQCDRCKTIFEPRVLAHGEPYIARKGKADLDLCPNCYNMFTDFINATSPGRASYVDYHTITVLEEIKSRLLPSMTEENEALDKTIKAMMHEPFLADALNKARAEIKEIDKRIEELKEENKVLSDINENLEKKVEFLMQQIRLWQSSEQVNENCEKCENEKEADNE